VLQIGRKIVCVNCFQIICILTNSCPSNYIQWNSCRHLFSWYCLLMVCCRCVYCPVCSALRRAVNSQWIVRTSWQWMQQTGLVLPTSTVLLQFHRWRLHLMFTESVSRLVLWVCPLNWIEMLLMWQTAAAGHRPSAAVAPVCNAEHSLTTDNSQSSTNKPLDRRKLPSSTKESR